MPGATGRLRNKREETRLAVEIRAAHRSAHGRAMAEMVREDLKWVERDELAKKHVYKAMDHHE